MIKTPLSTVIGGAGIWTPGCTVIGGQQNLTQLIKSLFANNEQGFAYDMNDLTTMFRDAAGTIPVTAAWQPVGLILDKSGNNNHAFATSSATRPILQRNATTGAYYLAFDGADDFLVTNNIDFSGAVDATVVAGFLTPRLNVRQFIVGYGGNAVTELGAFSLEAPTAALNNVGFRAKPATSSTLCTLGITQNTAYVVTASIASNYLIKLGVYGGDSKEVPFGSTTFGSKSIIIGSGVNDSLLQGHIYSLIGIGKLLSENETAAIEKELAKRTGVTLS